MGNPVKAVQSAAKSVANIATKAASSVASAAKNVASSVASAAKNVASTVKSAVVNIGDKVKDVAVVVKDKVADTVVNAVDKVKDVAVVVKDKVVSGVNTVLDKASGALQTVQSKINSAIETVGGAVSGVYNKVLEKVEVVGGKVFDVVNSVADKVGDGLKSVGLDKLGNFISDLPENVGDHIQKFAEDLPANISKGWEVVKDGVMNSLSKESLLAFVEGFASGGLVGAICGAVTTTVTKTVVQQIQKHQKPEEVDWLAIFKDMANEMSNSDGFKGSGLSVRFVDSPEVKIEVMQGDNVLMWVSFDEFKAAMIANPEMSEDEMNKLFHQVQALPTDTYSQEVLDLPVVEPSTVEQEQQMAADIEVQRQVFAEVGIVPKIPAKYESIIAENNSTWRGEYNTSTRRALMIGLIDSSVASVADAK